MLLILTSCDSEVGLKQFEKLRHKCGNDIRCYEGAAEFDFAKGRLLVFFQGMASEFDIKCAEYLRQQKGINVIFPGCALLPGDEAYTRRMEALIKTRFGEDLFLQAERAVCKKYPELEHCVSDF